MSQEDVLSRLEKQKEELKTIDSERDRITWKRSTQNVHDLLSAMAGFVDDHLSDTISAMDDAISLINELQERIEELESEED